MKKWHGGIHPQDKKSATASLPLERAAIPLKVAVPLQQHLGCPADPLVKVGDQVVEGQKIADSTKFVFAPIHAPISGKVTKIEKLPNACAFDVVSVVIESEPGAVTEAQYAGQWSVDELRPDQLVKIVKEAGIVGLGGATFPTHVKLSPPAEKKIDTIIINGCECEPYITADHRLMLERGEDVIYGGRVAAKVVGATRLLIGIEKNKLDAVSVLQKIAAGTKGIEVKVVALPTHYPQGGEKMLIKALLGREVPSGGLPLDVGVIVQNVGTAVAIAEAVKLGKPLIERALTVTGSGVKQPRNLIVRLGTSFAEVINQCGGLTEDAAKVIMGGPMTGLTITSLELPVVKGTSCLLVLNRQEAKTYEEKDCIRCGRCIKTCPMGLEPLFLVNFAKSKDWDKLREYHVADCIECGCCSYGCPSRIYLVQYFKYAKRELQTRKAVCK